MRICFIVNPVAGKGKAKDLIPLIEKVCTGQHIDFNIQMSTGKGNGTTIANQAIHQGYDKIVAVGGDGTINEVLNGMVGSDAALGVIPGGSGNDFIRSISAGKDTLGFLQDVLNGQVRKVDLGLCNHRYFINVGSVGLDAEVVIKRESAKKFFSGSLSYIVSALYTIFTYRGWNMNLQIDDQKIHSKTLLTAVANGKYYGGGIMPAPEANIDDGYYDICHIKHMSKIKMFTVFPKYMKGKHCNIKQVTFMKGKKITITCDRPFAINLDGEIMMNDKAEFSLIHEGINVIFPQKEIKI